MWWIIGVIALILLIFLWMIVHAATQGIDDDTQAMLDDEQTRAVTEYLQEREERKNRGKAK